MNLQDIQKELNKITITKRIDIKEFIADLKSIYTNTNYAEIMFTKDSNQILIIQPRSGKYINHIAKN